MKLNVLVGATSQIWQIFVADSSSTTGAGLTGLTNASSGLTAYYHRDTDTTATAISVVSMTVGTFTSGGFKEIDSTNMPGWYQFCPPNAAITTSAKSCGFHLKGVTNMAPLPIEVQLVSYNPDDGVRLGLTALPNAAAEASGGLYTRGTGAGQIKQTNNGEIDSNSTHINNVATTSVTTVAAVLGTTIAPTFTSSLMKVDLVDIAGSAVSTGSAQLGVNVVNFGGSAGTFAAGIPAVNTTKVNGTAQTARDLGLALPAVAPGGANGLMILGANTAGISIHPSSGKALNLQSDDDDTVYITNGGDFAPVHLVSSGAESALFIQALTSAITIDSSADVGVAIQGATDGMVITGYSGDGLHITGTGTGHGLHLDGGASGDDLFLDASDAPTVRDAVWTGGTRVVSAATNITSTGGTTVPQTGDAYAVVNSGTFGNSALNTKLGTPAGASVSADVATKQATFTASTSVTFPTNFGSMSIDSNGRVKIQSGVVKNVAIAGFEFFMVQSSDHVTGATGLTITATRSLDGGAYGACTNSAAEVSNGTYKIDLAAGDLNAATVTLKFSGSGADDRIVEILTTP